jgi:probable O-glycosylation ligase (exosortase A-associated)
MNIPFLFYLGLTEPHKWIKRGLLATVPLTCLTILLTGSRGGFLSMSATLGVIVWRSRNRGLGIAVAFIAAIVFLIFLPSNVKERLGTLGNVKEDSSANARLHTWGIALKMIAANPLQGVGLRNFQTAYPDYDPNPILQRGASGNEEARKRFFVAHNSYLQLAAESGIPALLIYLTIAALTFALLRRIRWMALRRYETNWILNYVRMFEASLVGFFLGAFFLNRAHYDFYYHLIAIIVSFSTIAVAEMTSAAKYPMRSGTGVARAFANRGFFGSRSSSPELRSLGAESAALPVMGSVAVKSAPEKGAARRSGFDTTPASRSGTVGFDRSTDSPLKGRL